MANEREEAALNLHPGDEVKIDGNWWIITEHTVDFRKAAPVTMQLRAREDNLISIIATNPTMRFLYQPR